MACVVTLMRRGGGMNRILASKCIQTKSGAHITGWALLMLCVTFLIALSLVCGLAPDSLKPMAGGGTLLWGLLKLFGRILSR
jgi:hypothetical protein